MAERCASISLPKLADIPLGSITVGATAPAISVPVNACCLIANFGWTLGSGILSTPPLVGPVADALEVLEQVVDDYNAAAEFAITCPGN